MIADKVEDNPVYQDQVRKRKKMLCAAFAAAACATGALFAIAKDNPNKMMFAGGMTAIGVYISSPRLRKKALAQEMAVFKPTSEPYGPFHPHQVFVDETLKDRKGAKVVIYKCPHEGLTLSGAVTDMEGIYISTRFEEIVNNDRHVKAFAAHEIGHMQEGDRMRVLNSFALNISVMASATLPIMVGLSPVTWPVMAISFAASAGLYLAARDMSSSVLQREEHIADIRGMYNLGHKTLMQDAVTATHVAGHQILSEDLDKYNIERVRRGLQPIPKPEPVAEDYSSRFHVHPNPVERRKVMDETAKFMP
jgi:Zn-dependent protease with chaperone function